MEGEPEPTSSSPWPVPRFSNQSHTHLPTHKVVYSDLLVGCLTDWLSGNEEAPWSVHGSMALVLIQFDKLERALWSPPAPNEVNGSRPKTVILIMNSEICCLCANGFSSSSWDLRVTLFVELICKLLSAALHSATAFSRNDLILRQGAAATTNSEDCKILCRCHCFLLLLVFIPPLFTYHQSHFLRL